MAVLATARHEDGRLLVVRHLPDRGTVAVGWWGPDENGAVAPGPSGLELVAEAVGVDAVARLGPGLAAAGWAPAEEGRTVAVTRPPPMVPRSWPCAPVTACGWSGSPRAVT